MSDMRLFDADDAVETLYERFPDIRSLIDKERAEWRAYARASPSADLVFGGSAISYALKLAGNLDQPDIRGRAEQFFAFLEGLLTHENSGCHSLVEVSFLEQLATHPIEAERLRAFMGLETRLSYDQLSI